MVESVNRADISLADIYYKLGSLESALIAHLKSEEEQFKINEHLHTQLAAMHEDISALKIRAAWYSGAAAALSAVGTLLVNKFVITL